ncbi:M56 family metallopeptidase [Pedobacter sp. JY14-1]|uniref:M56 family metallopeptidase n=1 Tax=Pedobacter sp. JY14-1 TaxID=3034151 RepID=UPI0023E0DD65|nr:M56 family metallopeptidase [Pedobacter sp. JY14-1]
MELKALYDMILHSFWQGALLAAAGVVITLTTRRSGAALRYRLLVASLLLFAVSAAATFLISLEKHRTGSTIGQPAAGQHAIVSGSANAGITDFAYAGKLNADTGLFRLLDYLNAHAEFIVTGWLLIVLLRMLQLTAGLYHLHGLRTRKIAYPGADWQGRLDGLAVRLGLTATVRLAESGLAKVPMVIGHLKPLVLLPAGMLTALPPQGIEAILLHELAHILRRDYLVNLMQSLLEIIFFFNPAVLWISGMVRAERENCCDDLAVAHSGSKAAYIEALVFCEEQTGAGLPYAMAFAGMGSRKYGLLHRVKRIVSGDQANLNVRDRLVLLIMVLSTVLLTVSFSWKRPVGKPAAPAAVSALQQAAPSAKRTITVRSTTVSHSKTETPGEVPEKNAPKITSEADKDTVAIHPLSPISARQSKLQPVAALSVRQGSVQPVAEEPLKPQTPLTPIAYKAGDNDYQPKTPTIGEKVLKQLIDEGLVSPDDQNVSFKLNEKEMIINGQRQSPEIFSRYKARHVPQVGSNSWTLYYNYDTETEVKP